MPTLGMVARDLGRGVPRAARRSSPRNPRRATQSRLREATTASRRTSTTMARSSFLTGSTPNSFDSRTVSSSPIWPLLSRRTSLHRRPTAATHMPPCRRQRLLAMQRRLSTIPHRAGSTASWPTVALGIPTRLQSAVTPTITVTTTNTTTLPATSSTRTSTTRPITGTLAGPCPSRVDFARKIMPVSVAQLYDVWVSHNAIMTLLLIPPIWPSLLRNLTWGDSSGS